MWRRLLPIGTSATSGNLRHKTPGFKNGTPFSRRNGRSALSVEEVHLKRRRFGGGYLRQSKSLIDMDKSRVEEVAEVIWSN